MFQTCLFKKVCILNIWIKNFDWFHSSRIQQLFNIFVCLTIYLSFLHRINTISYLIFIFQLTGLLDKFMQHCFRRDKIHNEWVYFHQLVNVLTSLIFIQFFYFIYLNIIYTSNKSFGLYFTITGI